MVSHIFDDFYAGCLMSHATVLADSCDSPALLVVNEHPALLMFRKNICPAATASEREREREREREYAVLHSLVVIEGLSLENCTPL